MSLTIQIEPTKLPYDFHDMNKLAKAGFSHVKKYLNSLPNIAFVTNVEEDPYYQELDIDGIAGVKKDGAVWGQTFEIKVDTYFDKTKNYFFETISNSNKCSEGCFLKSKAEYLFYYFLDRELHIFKLKEGQDWLIKHGENYNTAKVKNKFYYSEGILVPREEFMKDNNVKVINMRQQNKEIYAS